MCLKDGKKQPQKADVEANPSASTEAAAGGDKELKEMTPDIFPAMAELEWIVLSVRDLSSMSAANMDKGPVIICPNNTVSGLFSKVASTFRYDAISFALTFQKSNGETVELNEVAPDTCLADIGITNGSTSFSYIILTDLHGVPPRKIEEDDLSLGASASPTSSVSSERKWFNMSRLGNNYDAPEETPSSSSVRIKQEPVGYVGLVNQAMTCYLNSLLQTLFMTPEFRNALYRWEFKGTEEEAAKSIPYQLQRLFLQLQTATRSAVETTSLTKSFGWDSSEVWQQHDIQELYRVMFDALEQCFKNTDQAELINNLYEGKMKDYVKCLECGTENAREDSFLDIPLPIRPFGSNTAYKSVEEALRAFVEPELLTGNNKYECTKCSTHCDAHKGLKFTRFPYLLTLHLKRFDFDYQTFHRIKLNDKVTFPSILDLNAFIESSCCKESSQQSNNATSSNSPDKCSHADKLDDASTSDSGSALDAEESSSVGFSASNQMSNDTDTQDEDEGIDIDVSSVYNEKNRLMGTSNGPYVYELFSIMVHSGSASGGHYYAYIKDLKTGEWFCFNDQSVSRITYDDVRKTYGGSTGRVYYSSWSSSANAYMLMYRQANKERNVDTFTEETFPPHIKELVQKMVTEEAAEREAREIDRHMCKIKLFCEYPKTFMVHKKFKVHKDATLKEATKLAYEEIGILKDVVPLERCRLVKYEEVNDIIECSFTGQENEPIFEVLGGVRSSYKFELMLEIRDEDKEFEDYKPGGVTVKVHTVNLSTEEVEGPHVVRAAQSQTVREFKQLIGRALSMDPNKMRIVQEKYYDHKPLLSDSRTLKELGFYRSMKVYVEASGEEAPNFFAGSQMLSILDRYEHTINLHINLPERTPEVLKELQIPPYNPEEAEQTEKLQPSSQKPETLATSVEKKSSKEKVNCIGEVKGGTASLPSASSTLLSSSSTSVTSTISTATSSITTAKEATSKGMGKSFVSPSTTVPVITAIYTLPAVSVSSISDSCASAIALSDEEDPTLDTDVVVGSSSSTVNSDQSASEDSSLTSDSDRTLVGEPPEDNLSDSSSDYHNVSSPEDNQKSDTNDELGWGPQTHCAHDTGWDNDDENQSVKRYFRAYMNDPDSNVLSVFVDKRITIGQLKTELQRYIGVSEEHFKLYKYYINSNHEFECTRMTETLSSYGDNNVMKIRLGRALLPGEYKGKVFLLEPTNSEDPAKFLIDFVIRKSETVSKVKEAIVKEVNSKCGMNLEIDKTRLRKKSWKNPQTIFLDHQIFDDDIIICENWEYYLQVLDGPEQKTDNPDELSVFLKRFRPSSYSADPFFETVVPLPTAEALREQISKVSNIPLENVEFSKGNGTFPCDMSVLDIPIELDWSPKSGPLDKKPLCIIDDGAVIYYKDSREPIKVLTESEKIELETEENSRLNREHHNTSSVIASSVTSSTRIREKGLKIYLNQSSKE